MDDESPGVVDHSVELVLLPSPLLGPAAWAPAAEALRRRGWSTLVCGLPREFVSPSEVLRHFLESVPPQRAVVLVPHSNAGLFVPGLARERHVVASLFVDAALPPREGSTRLAPATLLDLLESKADADGLLPPWTQWWEPSDLGSLFPDEVARRRVEAGQPRLPLAYFHSSLDVPAGWSDLPSAYLAFGDTYAEERDRAAAWGWPVATLAGQHLHMMVVPDEVADAVTGLLQRLGV